MTLYIPPHFRMDDAAAQLAFIERYPFATLVTASPSGELHASHLPFHLRRDDSGAPRLLAHLARANPQARALEGAASAMAIFNGPHAYVSPGWYANHPSVPTWNYAVVHAHGPVRLLDEAELHELLMEISETYESPRPKPWRMGELPAPYVDSMLKMIAGFEIAVERLDAKYKLSQNRPAEVPRVIDALEAEGAVDVASLMRSHVLPRD